MRLLRPEHAKGVSVAVASLRKKRVPPDAILALARSLGVVVALIRREAVISERQVLNAVYNYLNAPEIKGWVRDAGLRLLCFLVGERQVRRALEIAAPEAEDTLLIALSSDEEKLGEYLSGIKGLGVEVLDEVRYAEPSDFSRLYGFDPGPREKLERDIMRKVAMLRIELYRAF